MSLPEDGTNCFHLLVRRSTSFSLSSSRSSSSNRPPKLHQSARLPQTYGCIRPVFLARSVPYRLRPQELPWKCEAVLVCTSTPCGRKGRGEMRHLKRQTLQSGQLGTGLLEVRFKSIRFTTLAEGHGPRVYCATTRSSGERQRKKESHFNGLLISGVPHQMGFSHCHVHTHTTHTLSY